MYFLTKARKLGIMWFILPLLGLFNDTDLLFLFSCSDTQNSQLHRRETVSREIDIFIVVLQLLHQFRFSHGHRFDDTVWFD